MWPDSCHPLKPQPAADTKWENGTTSRHRLRRSNRGEPDAGRRERPAAGTLPTAADLEGTIRGGLAGTAMPAFNNLSDLEIKAVTEYVKSFSSRWRNPANYAPPLPAWFESAERAKSRAEKGRDLFFTACVACHGTDGSGRGASAKELEDSWGRPATPSDLRQPALRSGRTLEAVYRVLLTGIDDAPMPSFTDALTEE